MRRLLITLLYVLSACVFFFTSTVNAANNSSNKTSRSTHFTYNELGLLTAIDGPREDVKDITLFEYDNQGRLIKVINALGHTTEILAYNALGKPLSIKNANGVISQLSYNGFGWLTSVTVNDKTTGFEYDALAQITKTILPNNSFIMYEYDEAHRLIAVSDNIGNRVDYQLDLAGNRVKTDIKNNAGILKSTQQQVFDELSRLRVATNGVGDSTQFDYDKNDSLTTQTDALASVTQHSYDALGRLTATVDANNGETQYDYDQANRISTITDAEGKTTYYQYSSFDERIKRISPDSATTQYAYDNAGNMLSTTDARGVTTQYQYDALSRLNAVIYANSKENIYYRYDDNTASNYGIGKLTQVNDSAGQRQFTYNANDQLINESYVINQQSTSTGTQTSATQTTTPNTTSESYNLAYQYSINGVISGITYPSGRQVNFTLNELGFITDITTKNTSETTFQSIITNASYLPFGPITSYTYGNGLQATRSYDLDYRITSDNLANIKQQTLSYSKNSNIAAINDEITSSNNQSFTYNNLSQLTSATGNYGELQYSYDKIGNRLNKSKTANTTEDNTQPVTNNDTYSYQNDNHHLTHIKQNTQGTQTPTPKRLSRFNQAGRLEQLTTNTDVTQYLYNYRGLRVSKQNSNEHIHYHYDSNGLLIAESNAAGQWQKEYVYFNNELIALYDYSQSGEILYYVHSDYLGTPKFATNTSKNLVWQANYTPFGLATINDDVDNNNVKLTFNSRFPGQYYDKESKLHYNWFRYYDPLIGRYTKSDPIGLEAGVNTYGYVGGNPVIFIDFFGLNKGSSGNGTHWRNSSSVRVQPNAVERILRKAGMRRENLENLANAAYMESAALRGMYNCSCSTDNSKKNSMSKQCTPSNPYGVDQRIDNSPKLVPSNVSLEDTGCYCGIGVTVNNFINPPPFKPGLKR